LAQLAGSRVAYLGLVASRRRAAAVLAGLGDSGVDSTAQARIRSPAGIDFSAETPEEIALSILAQITQVRRTSGPRELPVSDAVSTPRRVEMEKDVVCGMDVKADSPIRAMHAGRTYLFCSDGCRARFVKTPASFLS